MHKIVIAFAGMLACAGAAFADGYKDQTRSDGYFDADGSWRQFSPGGLSAYVGGHGGVSIANTDVGLLGVASLDGIGSHGAIGGVHAGLDYTLHSIFFGLYGLYDWQSTESNVSVLGFSASVGLRDSYGFGGRLGYDWGKAKAYGLVGWRHTNLEWSTSVGPPAGFPSGLTGIDLGAGIAIPFASCLELGIEGVWTKFNSESIGLGTVTIDPQQLAVMGRQSIRFDH